MLDNMFAPKEKIEYVVAFQANPDYTGDYQKGVWTDKDTGEAITNVYGKFRTPALAREAAAKCIKWCSDEPYPTYREGERGKTIVEWHTRHHDNIILKIYKVTDGDMNSAEEIPLCESDEKPASKSKKKEPQPV